MQIRQRLCKLQLPSSRAAGELHSIPHQPGALSRAVFRALFPAGTGEGPAGTLPLVKVELACLSLKASVQTTSALGRLPQCQVGFRVSSELPQPRCGISWFLATPPQEKAISVRSGPAAGCSAAARTGPGRCQVLTQAEGLRSLPGICTAFLGCSGATAGHTAFQGSLCPSTSNLPTDTATHCDPDVCFELPEVRLRKRGLFS